MTRQYRKGIDRDKRINWRDEERDASVGGEAGKKAKDKECKSN